MLRQGKSIEYVTIRFYAHFKPGVNRHHANDFEARIRAFEVADGCGFSACEGTRTAPRPHQWVSSAVQVSENLVPPGGTDSEWRAMLAFTLDAVAVIS
jgi:hypothetical protein